MDLTEVYDFIKEELKKDEDIPCISVQKEITYYSEVRSIMYACGDAKNPLKSSAKLMYKILQDEMALLIKKAEVVMKLREGNKLSHEDVLFLMRKNKMLLKRLLKFLSVEDMKRHLSSSTKNDEFSQEKGENVSKCLKYLSFIEKFTGDLTSVLKDENIVDHVYMKRLQRRDLMTKLMNLEEYKHFYEYALKVHFCQRYTTEIFKRWIQQCSCTKTDITPLALLIIRFLTRETIAGVVDKALEIKSRKQKENGEILKELEHDVDKSKSNWQLSFSEASEDSSYNKNYNIEDSSDAPVENKIDKNNIVHSLPDDMQETSLKSSSKSCTNSKSDLNFDASTSKRKAKIPSHSHKNSSTKNCENYKSAAACNSKIEASEDSSYNKNYNIEDSSGAPVENKIDKNNIVHSLPDDMQETSLKSSSKSCTNSKSDLNFDASTSKIPSHSHKNSSTKNCENYKSAAACNSKIEAKILSNSCKESSSKSCENSKSANVPSSKRKQSDDDSKKVKKNFYFSLNFEEKPLSICCDVSKTIKITTSSPAEEERFTDTEDLYRIFKTTDTEDKDWATYCSIEYIEESASDSSQTENFAASSLLSDCGNIEMDDQVYWFPENPITPEEIQAALYNYQDPLPMPYIMMSELSCLPPGTRNLICLANPHV